MTILNRKAAIKVMVLCCAFIVSSCDNVMANPDELSCLNAIRSSLINPETASFHDFQKMGEKDGKALYVVRVRAEGQLGNTITHNYGCMEDDELGMVAMQI